MDALVSEIHFLDNDNWLAAIRLQIAMIRWKFWGIIML